MVSVNDKLFVQIEPDKTGKTFLRDLQRGLDDSGRLVTQYAIHLSVIHIGKVCKLLDALRPHTTTAQDTQLQLLDELANKLVAVTTSFKTDITLQPAGYDFFGANKSTFVVLFEPTDVLQELHRQSLRQLQIFLSDVGIENVECFMQQDANLRYALTLAPHVALAQSYHGKTLDAPLQPITFSMMPVVYDH